MNNNYSASEIFLRRWITPSLQAACEDRSIVILTGARQVGKTALLLNTEPFAHWRYYSLDDFDTLRQARAQPEALWAGADQVIIDEFQKEPKLLQAIKRTVDQHPGRCRFLLAGSANLLVGPQTKSPAVAAIDLTGRAAYFILNGLTLGEMHQSPPPDLLQRALEGDLPAESDLPQPPPDPTGLMLRGLLPPLLFLNANGASETKGRRNSQGWVRWWDSYVSNYLERDLRQVSQIDALLDFRRMMEYLGVRTGQPLNQSQVARESHLSQPTVHRYLNLLEITHLYERIPAYPSSLSSRSPVGFWADPGLGVFLSGNYDEKQFRQAREYDHFFVSLIYHHLRVLARLMVPAARLYFWRGKSGAEVDFVIEQGRRVLAVVVNRTNRPGFADASGLRAFLAEHPEAAGGLLVHGGEGVRRLDEKIAALPWSLLTGYGGWA